MRLHTDEALILRTYRYGEADRIVVFLTEDHGKRRGVARNASASRRRFGAGLEPMTRGRVAYVARDGRELVRLDRVEPSSSPLRAADGHDGRDVPHVLGMAAYFAELIDEWAPDGSPNERLFRLGAAAADALAQGGDVEALARYFEYWLLRLEGVYPAVDACPRCGRALDDGAALALGDRAYVCAGCGQGGVEVSSAAIGFVRRASRLSPADVGRRTGLPEALGDLERAHGLLIAAHLEREVRSARIVKELKADS